MVLKEFILQVADSQRANLDDRDAGLFRDALTGLPGLKSHVLIVSGIRRCGKSTLLFQLLQKKYSNAFYLNFEDPRLYDFEKADLLRLDEVIREKGAKVLLFDEIQVIPEWERYVRGKLDEGYMLVVTGSNASLLSNELGTKLTGRHITKELFPFSYPEYCTFLKKKQDADSLIEYLHTGGFPEYARNNADEILHHLFEDILVRDIAVRFGVRDLRNLQRLALYLVSNPGKLISANRLKSLFDISATSTMLEYLSHLEQAYLFQFVPKFSYSPRKQLINPRKVYAIDTGMISVNSNSFTDDNGWKLENLVYLHLRRQYKDIYYYAEKRECDFVIQHKGKIMGAVQVCYRLDQDNMKRELEGLEEAMRFFGLKNGTIVTLDQKEKIKMEKLDITVVPCHEWLTGGN